MTGAVWVSGGHCCACSRVCHHIGPASFCEMHRASGGLDIRILDSSLLTQLILRLERLELRMLEVESKLSKYEEKK